MVNEDFDQMYTKYSGRIWYIAYSFIKDWHKAEDVVQEAFIKAYKKVASIEDTEKMDAWLAQITSRTAIDYLRAENRSKMLPTDLWVFDHSGFHSKIELSTEAEVEILLFKEDINKTVHHLSNEYREVLVLRLQYGLKENEIAERLRLKSSTVKTRLHRARKKLKEAISITYPA
ncbi:RNA polymerase sigma factor [Mesobacillus foraminis]|nr:sigma-70 family RNA polymerase sigma factor [Mesobacillus foraminis]